MQRTQNAKRHKRKLYGSLIILAAFLVLLYLILPSMSGVSLGAQTFSRGNLHLLLIAVGFTMLSYVAAALTYIMLAPKTLPYIETLRIQIATGFVGHALPSGAGHMGLYMQYLRRRGHTLSQASAVVALNSSIAIFENIVIILAILLFGHVYPHMDYRIHLPTTSVIIALSMLVAIAAALLFIFRSQITKFVYETAKHYKRALRRPYRMLFSLTAAVLLTLSYATVLVYCARAFNLPIDLPQAILVMALGSFAVAITPTPGGLGGSEAGLILGFMAFGISQQDATVVALVYRFITYWLPLLPGFVMFLSLRKKYLF